MVSKPLPLLHHSSDQQLISKFGRFSAIFCTEGLGNWNFIIFLHLLRISPYTYKSTRRIFPYLLTFTIIDKYSFFHNFSYIVFLYISPILTASIHLFRGRPYPFPRTQSDPRYRYGMPFSHILNFLEYCICFRCSICT